MNKKRVPNIHRYSIFKTLLAFSLHLSEAKASEYGAVGLREAQSTVKQQELSARDYVANESLEFAEILDVF